MKTVTIIHVRDWAGDTNTYVTEHTYSAKEMWNSSAFTRIELKVDIPDRFKPIEDEEGRIIVTVGGRTVGLSKVLGVGADGGPVIEWIDEEGGFKRTVSLKQHLYHFKNGERIE